MLEKFDIASQSMAQSPVPTTLSASATARFDGALASPLVVGAGVGVATVSEDDSKGASGVGVDVSEVGVEYVSGVGVADGVFRVDVGRRRSNGCRV